MSPVSKIDYGKKSLLTDCINLDHRKDNNEHGWHVVTANTRTPLVTLAPNFIFLPYDLFTQPLFTNI